MSTVRRIVVRRGPLSARLEARALTVGGVLLLATLAALTLHVGRGEYPIAPGDVLAALVGAGDKATSFVVVDLRLPRALTAVLVGAALGIAGAVFQDLARNPLAAPDILGVTTGASLATVTLIVFGNTAGAISLPVAAATGALATGAALYLLAWRQGLQGHRLVLVGIGVQAVLQAGISYVLTRGEIYETSRAYIWIVGSLNGRGWEHVWPLAIVVGVLAPAALALSRGLGALQLGDDVARALGARLERSRLGLMAVAVVLTGAAVAAAGPIAFVAFVAPHVARRLARSVAPSTVLAVSAVCGALLVVGADLAGRLLFGAAELPVGIITAVLAAPYFLHLLVRTDRPGATA